MTLHRPKTDALFLSIDRHFDAPVARVFRLWSDTQLRQRWWGPKDFTCTALHSDFRPGGPWSATIASVAHGTHRMEGVYRQIVPDAEITFTFRWLDDDDQPPEGTVVEVTLRPTAAGGTRLTFRQGPFLRPSTRDSHTLGWTECLDRLSATLSKDAA